MDGGLESRCVGRVYCADGTVRVARHLPHYTYDLRIIIQTNSVQKAIRCNSTSNAPDDGRMLPKRVELRIHNKITLLHQVGISHYFMRKMQVKQLTA